MTVAGLFFDLRIHKIGAISTHERVCPGQNLLRVTLQKLFFNVVVSQRS